MSPPAARLGDRIVALDMHLIQPPPPATPVMVPHPFNGIITGNTSPNVTIAGAAAATVGSTATNTPPHIPIGGSFVNPPTNQGSVQAGSATVSINGRAAARAGDTARTCDDTGRIGGLVVAAGTVVIGG